MSKKKIADWSCPECGSRVVIYKGWATFKGERIKVENGAKWRCSNCGEIGKLDEEDKK